MQGTSEELSKLRQVIKEYSHCLCSLTIKHKDERYAIVCLLLSNPCHYAEENIKQIIDLNELEHVIYK